MKTNNLLPLEKFELEDDDVLSEVVEGLTESQKRLPTKLFYDRRGSLLFDRITELEEYYPTRTEMRIMEENIEEITDCLGTNCLLIELGSGNSTKIRLLLDNLREPAAYVPIDISEEHLVKSARALAEDYPGLRILPVYADYTQQLDLPEFDFPYSRKVSYFPGSTIGNFTSEEAREFLNRIGEISGEDGGLLIGVDLKKDKETLEAAYNDREGVTAEFNQNILRRLNRELDSDFDLEKWEHLAFYNTARGRIEMHLLSLGDQRVSVDGTQVFFERDETILTEYSYKYTLQQFEKLASGIFNVEKVWTDEKERFSVQYLTVG